MNWTGGGLSRSRNARDSLSAKQKSYFAKARARQSGGKSSRPVIHSFDFGDWKPSIVTPGSTHPSQDSRRHLSRQKLLEEYDNVRPPVEKLDTLKRTKPSSKPELTPLPKTPEPIVIGSSPVQSPSSSPEPQSRSHDVRFANRSDDAGTLQAPGALHAPDIESMRRRLLEMDDWVGINRPTSKPLTMTFADPADTDLIGKRRRTNHEHPSNVRRPVPRMPITLVKDTRGVSDPYGLENLSVRIGSAVDRSTKGDGLRKDHDSILSDELLFDSLEPPPSARKLPTSVAAFRSPRHNLSNLINNSVSSVSCPSPLRREISDPRCRETNIPSASKRSSPTKCRDPLRKVPEVPDNRHREILTPSAFMSSNSSQTSDLPEDRMSPNYREREILTPSAFMDVSSSGISAGSSEIAERPFLVLPPPSHAPLRTIDDQELTAHVPSSERPPSRGEHADALSNIPRSSPDRVLPSSARNKLLLSTHEQSKNRLDSKNIALEHEPTTPTPAQFLPTKLNDPDSQRISEREKEEAAWRKIVFGDEASDDETTDPASFHRHDHTQPSLIAEIDTSPLKQNPHLVDNTFDESTIYRRDTSPLTEGISEHITDISSPAPDLWGIPPRKQVYLSSDELDPEGSSRPHELWSNHPARQDYLSSDELTRSPTHRNSPPTKPPTHHPITTNPSRRPVTELRAAAASNPPPLSPPAQKTKILYKKPPRYEGERSSDRPEPMVIGSRVLRSGRRISDKGFGTRGGDRGEGRERGRKGKGNGAGGVDGDDIVDD